MKGETAGYGSWQSQITAQNVAEGQIKIKQLEIDKEEIYWLEARPKEKGRCVFVRAKEMQDLFKAPYNARTTVHEYGGNSGIIHEGTLYFCNFQDQNLYQVTENGEPKLVIDLLNKRLGDFSLHPNGKWLYAVMEEHFSEGKITNQIVKIDIETKTVDVLASGHDFYGSPRINPEGDKIVFYSWDHPNMPWDGTDLWLCDLDVKGNVETEKKIAGGKDESVIEPKWSSRGVLYFVSDRDGYWNLYNEDNEPIYEINADFSLPPWELGNSSYTFIDIGGKPHIAAIITEKAIDSLVLIDLKEKKLTRIPLEYTVYQQLKTRKGSLVFIGSSPQKHPEIVSYDPTTQKTKILYKASELSIDEEWISLPRALEFPTTNHKTAYAFYYPPKNPHFKPLLEEQPPLIVFVHGGPTAHVTSALKLVIQFWTSRGFAVADVNYGGSSGYGREYRDRLKMQWGIVDVDDCCNAASYLVEKKLADPKRLAIRGGSAGGYTTLAALTFKNTFQVGASLYGIGDLEMLAHHTHKFEAHYLDLLIGKYPEKKSRYIELSPLHNLDKLSCPTILLQGSEDQVVPKEQSQKMYEALLSKKIPTAYLLFEGEQHGFRQAENIIKALEAEYYFYCTLFEIPIDAKIPPIAIANLKK